MSDPLLFPCGVVFFFNTARARPPQGPRAPKSRASLEPNLADGVVSIAAAVGDAKLHRAFQKASRDARTPQERLRFLLALCGFSDPALISKTQALLLRDSVPTQDVAFVLVRLLQNRAAQQSTWDFLRERCFVMVPCRSLDCRPGARRPTTTVHRARTSTRTRT